MFPSPRSNPAAFRIAKWYTDCVSEAGALFVGYWADLCWRGLRLTSAASLTRPAGACGVPRHRTTLRAGPGPMERGDALAWVCPALRLHASWTRDAGPPPLERVLLETADGSVRWSCRFPRALAAVQIPGLPPLHGHGYAELLQLTIAPWSLPIDELRWGRYLSDRHTAVWIEWRGPEPRRLLFVDGCEASSPTVSDAALAWIDAPATKAMLTVDQGIILRDGAIGGTALAHLPGLGRIFPSALLHTTETKWLSRGTLHRPGHEPDCGWAIHEVVRFAHAPASLAATAQGREALT